MLLADRPNIQQAANQIQAEADNLQQAARIAIEDDGGDHVDEMDADPHEISTSDFIILQSSFECKFHVLQFTDPALPLLVHVVPVLHTCLYLYMYDLTKSIFMEIPVRYRKH